jgi:hypothetical protein
LAPDTSGLGPFTELEKAEAVGFLAYGQLTMKCPVSRQLKHTLELLLLAVTWLVLLCGGFMVFWLLYGLNWVLGPGSLWLATGFYTAWGLGTWTWDVQSFSVSGSALAVEPCAS